LDALGLEDSLERGVLAVEWGEKLPPSLLVEALWLEIDFLSELERSIGVRVGTPQGRGVKLHEAWSSVVLQASAFRG
jgi:tRNA A37 threonylcarbamoyladenosine biosynthesis protein TsaE